MCVHRRRQAVFGPTPSLALLSLIPLHAFCLELNKLYDFNCIAGGM